MMRRRKVVRLNEAEEVQSTISRLEVLADNLEITAKALEDLVAHLREEEEVQSS